MNKEKLNKIKEDLAWSIYCHKENIFKIFWNINKLFGKIKKIIDYIPLLWKDEDWDFAYLLDLIEYKARRMADCISKNGYIVESRDIRIQTNELIYHMNNYRDSEELTDLLYGKLPFEVEYRPISLHDGSCKHSKVRSDNKQPLSKEEEELYTQRFYKEQEVTKSEWHKIWETLDKNCQGWWD